MRPPWFRPIPRNPATTGRWRHGTLWLVGLLSYVIAWTATPGITLSIDCPNCGPNQPFPHVCPPDGNAPAALPTPNPLPGFLDEARKQHRRLLGIGGLDLPDLGEARSLGELDAALARLIAATEAEIDRCDRERADFVRKGATAEAERTRLAQLAVQLTAQIEQLRRETSETERDNAAQIRAATAARDETRQLQKALTAIREEIRQVRNRLFPRLHRAAGFGWILPPSNYRQPPGPLPVKLPPGAVRKSVAATPLLPSTGPGPGGVRALPLPTPTTVPLGRAELRQSVEFKLEQLPLIGERARTALARRADAIRSLEAQRNESEAESARLSALEPQRAALASQAAVAKRNAVIARQTFAEYAARLADARAAAVYAWVEWGIFQLLDKKAEALLANQESNRAGPTVSPAWSEVAAAAAELGSDPLGLIARWPTAMSARSESLDVLQRDLAGVREKFGLGFARTAADVPPAAAPYLAKGTP